MKLSPSACFRVANRSPGTRASPVKRSPSTGQPLAATVASSSALSPADAFRAPPRPNGRLGWLSTGATTVSSSSLASPKPPVKHMPTNPMPGPPWRPWRSRARARSQAVAGEESRVARTWNSRLTHALAITPSARLVDDGLPGVPKSDAIATEKPRSTSRSAKWATVGVIPGISGATRTQGPVPRWYTSWVIPSALNGSIR